MPNPTPPRRQGHTAMAKVAEFARWELRGCNTNDPEYRIVRDMAKEWGGRE